MREATLLLPAWPAPAGEAVMAAATSGSPRFFLGTDSAPHAKHAKESACGCAGIFSAPLAMQLYAQVRRGW